MLPCSVRQVLALSAPAAEEGQRILGGASSKLRKLGYLRLMIGGRSGGLNCINSVSSKNLNTPFWQSELSASSATSVLARGNLLTSLFSPDELRRMRFLKLSEMGYEQRSRRAFGRYLVDDTGRKVASQQAAGLYCECVRDF